MGLDPRVRSGLDGERVRGHLKPRDRSWTERTVTDYRLKAPIATARREGFAARVECHGRFEGNLTTCRTAWGTDRDRGRDFAGPVIMAACKRRPRRALGGPRKSCGAAVRPAQP